MDMSMRVHVSLYFQEFTWHDNQPVIQVGLSFVVGVACTCWPSSTWTNILVTSTYLMALHLHTYLHVWMYVEECININRQNTFL